MNDNTIRIDKILGNLQDQPLRIIHNKFSLITSWIPSLHQAPLASEVGEDIQDVRIGYNEIVNDFNEEIKAISHGLSDPETGAICSRANAFYLWDFYALKVRVKGKYAYFIKSPSDIGSDPVIQVVPVRECVRLLTWKTAEQAKNAKRFQKWINILATYAIISGIVGVIIFFAIFK